MISKKIWIPIVAVCITGIIFGAYKAGTLASANAVINQQSAVVDPSLPAVTSPDTLTQPKEQAQTPTLAQSETSATPQAQYTNQSPPQPPPSLNPYTAGINQSIANGKIIEAKEGGLYATKKAVVVDKSVLFCVEGNRTADPDMLLPQGRYYAVIDFSIMNLQDKPYFSSFTNFVLKDSHEYTFTPVPMEGTVGDISGEVLSGVNNMKRGEIAFAVPTTEQQFTLQVETGLDTKCIDFTINAISPNLAWPKPYK
ncbi:MAG: DUF4352 domain-containing protein [Desulfosporosinus sp.]|nr:DUF4352 domain-containing protein [Desulfosporosinus sp.]